MLLALLSETMLLAFEALLEADDCRLRDEGLQGRRYGHPRGAAGGVRRCCDEGRDSLAPPR